METTSGRVCLKVEAFSPSLMCIPCMAHPCRAVHVAGAQGKTGHQGTHNGHGRGYEAQLLLGKVKVRDARNSKNE